MKKIRANRFKVAYKIAFLGITACAAFSSSLYAKAPSSQSSQNWQSKTQTTDLSEEENYKEQYYKSLDVITSLYALVEKVQVKADQQYIKHEIALAALEDRYQEELALKDRQAEVLWQQYAKKAGASDETGKIADK